VGGDLVNTLIGHTLIVLVTIEFHCMNKQKHFLIYIYMSHREKEKVSYTRHEGG